MNTQNEFFNLFILRNNPSRDLYYFFDHFDTFGLTSGRFWSQVIFHQRLPNQYDADHIGEQHGAWVGPTAVTAILAAMVFVAYKFTRDEKSLWIKGQLSDEFLLAYFALYCDDAGNYKPCGNDQDESVKNDASIQENKKQHELLRKLIDQHVDAEKVKNLKLFATKNRDVITEIIDKKSSQPQFNGSQYSVYDRIRWYFDGLVNNLAIPFAYTHWSFWMISTVILYQIKEDYCVDSGNPDRSNFSGAFSEEMTGNEALLWIQCFIGVAVTIAVWYYSKYKEDQERAQILGAEGRTNFVKDRGLMALIAPFLYFTEDKFLEAKKAEQAEHAKRSKYDALRGVYLKYKDEFDDAQTAKKENSSENLLVEVEISPSPKNDNHYAHLAQYEKHTQYTRELTIGANALGTFLLFNVVAWPIIVFATAGCGSELDDAPSQTIAFVVTAFFAGLYAKYKDNDLVAEREATRKAIVNDSYDPTKVIDEQTEKSSWDFWWKDKQNFHYACYFVIGRMLGNGGFLLTRILFMGGGGNVLTGALIDQEFESRPLERGEEGHHFDDNLLILGFIVTALMITLNMVQYRKRTQLSEISAHCKDVALESKAQRISLKL